MRSYSYHEGKWQLCKDTFPATAPSIMHDDYEAQLAFEQALEKQGFSFFSVDEYISRFGKVLVYARDHASLPAERKANEPFDFLCILHVGGSYIRMWIADLYNLFLFLSDIEAN